MIRDIQEKRIETELAILQESIIPTKFKKIGKDEYYIDVFVPYTMIGHDNIKNDINFMIQMMPNFPFSQPRVYCKTQFSYPHISDGRDLLEDILGQSWTPSFKIIDILDRLPEFVKEFIKNLQEGVLVLVGNYFLGEKYDLALLESLNIYVKKVKEKLIIEGKEKEIPKILLVSDIFFCLFDQEKWTKNNLHLTFWSNIRSLVTIKKLIKGDSCRFFWKQKNKKKNFEMILIVENSNDLVNLLLDKMSKFGINYKVSKNNLGPKQGVIPPIDIDEVERSILEFETKAEINPDMEVMQYLMTLYEKAVEYYSATNNPRWEFYTEKIHSILKSPRVKDFLDKDEVKPKPIQNVPVENKLEAEPDTFIPKEKRITHVATEDPVEEKNILHPVAEKIVSNLISREQMQKQVHDEKEKMALSSSIKNENLITQEPPVEVKEVQIEDKKQDQLKENKEQSEDVNFKNEQTGLKIEISHDEDQNIDYSDDDEDEEEDLSDKENQEKETK